MCFGGRERSVESITVTYPHLSIILKIGVLLHDSQILDVDLKVFCQLMGRFHIGHHYD